jgi:hypothetical protein
MTVLRIGKDGIPRDFFSGKIVNIENLKPALPKTVERQYEASAKQNNEAVQKTAERAFSIFNHGVY